jgi:hypothetical protein
MGPLSVKLKEKFKNLDLKRRQILKNKEQEWRMRSMSLWLQEGDENTKFFHYFSNGRKLQDTIWSVNIRDGSNTSSFEKISLEGTTHFKSLFKVGSKVNIDTVIRVASLFPRFIIP